MVSPEDLLRLLKQIWQGCADVACDTFDLKGVKAETMPLRKSSVEFGRRNLDAAREHDKLYVGKGQLRECLGRSSLEIANGDQVCAATTRDAASFTMSEPENGRRIPGDKVVNDWEIYCMIRMKTLYFVEKVATRCKW
jgi:hypothetical protein